MEIIRNNIKLINKIIVVIVLFIVGVVGYNYYKDNVVKKREEAFKSSVNNLVLAINNEYDVKKEKNVYMFPINFEYELDFKEYKDSWVGRATIDEKGKIYMSIYSLGLCGYKTKADNVVAYKHTTQKECEVLGEPILYSLLVGEENPTSDDKFLNTAVIRNKIETITFNNSTSINPDSIDNFDISLDQDKSVVLYYMDADKNGLYEVFIGAEDGINLNRNSEYLFQNLINLTNFYNVKNIKTTNVTNMKNMFYGLVKLKELNLDFFDTKNVTDMSNMFHDLKTVRTLDVDTFDTSNVTNMSGMFYGLGALKTIDLSKFDTSKVTNMSNMFYNMSSLELLDVSTFNTSNVTNMSGMFGNCNTVSKINLKGFDTSKVTDMNRMFFNDRSLIDIDVSSFTTTETKNLEYMFSGCSSLKELNLRTFDLRGATNLSYMMSNTGALEFVHIRIDYFEYTKGIDKGIKERSSLRYKKYKK